MTWNAYEIDDQPGFFYVIDEDQAATVADNVPLKYATLIVELPTLIVCLKAIARGGKTATEYEDLAQVALGRLEVKT